MAYEYISGYAETPPSGPDSCFNRLMGTRPSTYEGVTMYAVTYRPMKATTRPDGTRTYVEWPTVVLSGLTYEAAYEAMVYAHNLEGWSIAVDIVPMGGVA